MWSEFVCSHTHTHTHTHTQTWLLCQSLFNGRCYSAWSCCSKGDKGVYLCVCVCVREREMLLIETILHWVLLAEWNLQGHLFCVELTVLSVLGAFWRVSVLSRYRRDSRWWADICTAKRISQQDTCMPMHTHTPGGRCVPTPSCSRDGAMHEVKTRQERKRTRCPWRSFKWLTKNPKSWLWLNLDSTENTSALPSNSSKLTTHPQNFTTIQYNPLSTATKSQVW